MMTAEGNVSNLFGSFALNKKMKKRKNKKIVRAKTNDV
jgi:hypothetical protein